MDFATHNAALGVFTSANRRSLSPVAATGSVLDENTKHGGGFYYPYFDGVDLRKMHPSYTPNDE